MSDSSKKPGSISWPQVTEARVGVLTPPTALDPIKMVIREGLMSLQALVEQIDALEALAPPAPVSAEDRANGGGIIVSQPEIYEHCKNIGDALALASLTLFERKRLEKANERRDRAAKGEVVDAVCVDLDVSIFHNRRLRDRMVHVDEWIPRMVRRFPNSRWLTGMAITHRGMFGDGDGGVPIIYNRVFIFEEHRILHLEEELDLRALRMSAVALIERLA